MKLIVGLGNPGLRYERTRHNLGFLIIESLLKKIGSAKNSNWEENKRFKAEIAQVEFIKEKIILVRPQTFMNNSGAAVKSITDYYKINSSDIWIVHDDVDISLGNMKIRFGGASAGHKGVLSIIETLGTDKFWRFRMGIGKDKAKILHYQDFGKKSKLKSIDNYVLGEFEKGDLGKLRELEKKGVEALTVSLEKGLRFAMNKFNIK